MKIKNENCLKTKYIIKNKIINIVLLIIMIVNICNVSFASTIHEEVTVKEFVNTIIPYQYDNETRWGVQRINKKNKAPIYMIKKKEAKGVEFIANKFEECKDERIINILKNGYGAKTKADLKADSELDAFLATQEAIYIKLEGRNPEDYITYDDEGVSIINIAQEIISVAEEENNTNDKNATIEIIEKDKYWKNYELDNNFKYKTYTVLTNTEDEGTITIQKGENIKILDAKTNMEKDTFIANDTFYLVVPKDIEQQINVKLSYETEQFTVYSFKEDDTKEDTYLLPELNKKEISVAINQNVTGNVNIININKETKEPIMGNVFSIVAEDGAVVKENLVTNNEGKINLTLDKGKYYLKQTQTIEQYSINKALIEINIEEYEEVNIKLESTKDIKEEITTINKQINVVEQDKNITENNITEVSNIKTTNIKKEIINEINETNLNNVNNFINTINRKNVLNLQKENTYRNYIEELYIQNENLEGENKVINMTREDYINYIDMVMLNSFKAPILPVASK